MIASPKFEHREFAQYTLDHLTPYVNTFPAYIKGVNYKDLAVRRWCRDRLNFAAQEEIRRRYIESNTYIYGKGLTWKQVSNPEYYKHGGNSNLAHIGVVVWNKGQCYTATTGQMAERTNKEFIELLTGRFFDSTLMSYIDKNPSQLDILFICQFSEYKPYLLFMLRAPQ
jgi:hypothetical protein